MGRILCFLGGVAAGVGGAYLFATSDTGKLWIANKILDALASGSPSTGSTVAPTPSNSVPWNGDPSTSPFTDVLPLDQTGQ